MQYSLAIDVSKSKENKRYVDIFYFTMSRNKNTRRKVAPYNIWFFAGTFYLVGLCMKREEIRTFAFDRIKTLGLTEEIFQRPDDFSVEEYMRPSFGVFHGETTRVKIWFAPEAVGYVKEKIWHESQIISDQEDGSIIFEAEVAGTDEIKIWVMGWGSKAKVVEPESLRIKIISEINSLMTLYR